MTPATSCGMDHSYVNWTTAKDMPAEAGMRMARSPRFKRPCWWAMEMAVGMDARMSSLVILREGIWAEMDSMRIYALPHELS